MDEPLRKTVALRSYCEAVVAGLEQWLLQEEATPGKVQPRVALDGASLAVLRHAAEMIRERARVLSVVRVRIQNDEIQKIVISEPGHVRYRLECRIGTRALMPRYVEVETNDGPLWVGPYCQRASPKTLRIGVRVRYWDDRYEGLGAVEPVPSIDELELPFEPLLPPGYMERLARDGRVLHEHASAVPAIAERIRLFFEDLGILVEEARQRLFSRRKRMQVEVVRTGRIEIVEMQIYAVAGSAALAFDEPPTTDASTEILDATPTVKGIRALMTDLQAYYAEGLDGAADDLFDTLEGSKASEEEEAEQRVIADRYSTFGRQAARAAGAYLLACGEIQDVDEWHRTLVTEIVELHADPTGSKYQAQIRRRLGKAPAASPSIAQKHVVAIASRELPLDPAQAEHTIVSAARGAAEMIPTLPVFVPPLDAWVETSMMIIVTASRAVEACRESSKLRRRD